MGGGKLPSLDLSGFLVVAVAYFTVRTNVKYSNEATSFLIVLSFVFFFELNIAIIDTLFLTFPLFSSLLPPQAYGYKSYKRVGVILQRGQSTLGPFQA